MYFCLNVMTAKEEEAKNRLDSFLEKSGVEDFLTWFPKKEVKEKRQGSFQVAEKPLFPSYIFIYWGGERKLDFPFHEIRKVPTVIRILGYDDGSHALRGNDLNFAKWIHMHDGFIKQSKVVYREGQKVHITEGPLKGFDGNVVKVDKHHKRIKLRFELGGMVSEVSFTVEFLNAASTSDAPDRSRI